MRGAQIIAGRPDSAQPNCAVVYRMTPLCYNRASCLDKRLRDPVTESSGAATVSKRARAKWMRPLVQVAFTLVALLGANLLYANLATRSIVLSGVPGELLYTATFAGFTDEWDLYAGQQSSAIVDERLQISVASPQTAGWSAAVHEFADFDMSLSAIAVDGPIDNAFGIVFGMRNVDEGDCRLPAVVLCGLSQWLPLVGAALGQVFDPLGGTNYYAFLISSDGYYALRQIRDGEQTILSAWIPTDHIRTGLQAQNVIRVVAQGTEIRFYVNGELMTLCLSDATGATSTYAAGECIGGRSDAIGRRRGNGAI